MQGARLQDFANPWISLGAYSPVGGYWQYLGYRVAIMGGCYLAIAGAGLVTLYPLSFPSETSVLFVIVRGAFCLPFFYGAGMLLAGLLSYAIIPLVAGAIHLLDIRPRRDVVSMLVGGLVAGVATFPLELYAAREYADLAPWHWLTLQGAVALAIAMGQLAGAFASVRDLRSRYRGKAEAFSLRFTTRALLLAMVPIAVLLSALGAADLLRPYFAVAVTATVAMHFAMLGPVRWLANRWLDRRLARRRRQRLAECST